MNKDIEQIKVQLFGKEIGILAYQAITGKSYFQYNEAFLKENVLKNIFPFGIKRVSKIQIFNNLNNKTFKGIPAVFADSLPDDFGNTIYQEWIKAHELSTKELTPIHQLAYMANRGMGALEYFPAKIIETTTEVNLATVSEILKEVLRKKKGIEALKLSDFALLNIFKIGSSAGGARPKVIVSEHKETGKLIPGDIVYSEEYKHYLVKLDLRKDEQTYNRGLVEYAYYKMAIASGINMMPTKLISGQHLATERYDRVAGKKIHVLTATGVSGLDFREEAPSSYETLFKIANYLNVPPTEIDAIFRRMVFNFVFHNTDDHLKNHSFQYSPNLDAWNITPAYDINYSLDALNKWPGIVHALSLNNKRKGITLADLLAIAKEYSVNAPKTIIKEVETATYSWLATAKEIGVPENVAQSIKEDFTYFITKK